MVVGAYGPEAELRAGSPQGETIKISGGQRVLRNKALGIAGVTVLSSGIGLLIHGAIAEDKSYNSPKSRRELMKARRHTFNLARRR